MANPKFAKKEAPATANEAPKKPTVVKSPNLIKPKGQEVGPEVGSDEEKSTRRANANSDSRKLKVLAKENPYREGSKRAAAFAALDGATTVAEYMATEGAKAKYLSRWEAAEMIKIG